jgi:hypothetical protein
MKQYPWKFKLSWDGIEWWQSEVTVGSDNYFYYFHWGWMDKEMRKECSDFEKDSWFEKSFGFQNFGLHRFWYDCPHAQLNLYFIFFCWSTPWTKPPTKYRRKK